MTFGIREYGERYVVIGLSDTVINGEQQFLGHWNGRHFVPTPADAMHFYTWDDALEAIQTGISVQSAGRAPSATAARARKLSRLRAVDRKAHSSGRLHVLR